MEQQSPLLALLNRRKQQFVALQKASLRTTSLPRQVSSNNWGLWVIGILLAFIVLIGFAYMIRIRYFASEKVRDPSQAEQC